MTLDPGREAPPFMNRDDRSMPFRITRQRENSRDFLGAVSEFYHARIRHSSLKPGRHVRLSPTPPWTFASTAVPKATANLKVTTQINKLDLIGKQLVQAAQLGAAMLPGEATTVVAHVTF